MGTHTSGVMNLSTVCEHPADNIMLPWHVMAYNTHTQKQNVLRSNTTYFGCLHEAVVCLHEDARLVHLVLLSIILNAPFRTHICKEGQTGILRATTVAKSGCVGTPMQLIVKTRSKL